MWHSQSLGSLDGQDSDAAAPDDDDNDDEVDDMDAGGVTRSRTSGTSDNATSTQVSALTLCNVTRRVSK